MNPLNSNGCFELIRDGVCLQAHGRRLPARANVPSQLVSRSSRLDSCTPPFCANPWHVSSVNICTRFGVPLGCPNVCPARKLNSYGINTPAGTVRLLVAHHGIMLTFFFAGTNLVDFIQCPFNSATNRQSRMLTSSFTRCSSPSFAYSNLIDLNSAKENLQSMEFFGLTEYLPLSQRLFERTSYCRSSAVCSFQSYLEQDWSNNQTFDYIRTNISSADADRLRQMNSDDIELYRFARDLFFQRTCQTLGVACQPAL